MDWTLDSIQTSSGAYPASCPMGTGESFLRLKRGQGVTLTTHPQLVPRPRISRSYTSSPPSAFIACSGTALVLAVVIKLLDIHTCEDLERF
jgi:hypothetical protein